MGQHKLAKPEGTKPAVKYKPRLVNWPADLHARMEKARTQTAIPMFNDKGEQVGTRTPEMSECYILWMGTMMDLIDHATKQHERSTAMVLTPAELSARGAKLPLDLMRKA